MKNIFLLILLFGSHLIYAQKEVNNLHYVWTEHFKSAKKTDVKEKFQFNFNWDKDKQILVIDRTKGEKNAPSARYFVDQKRRITVELKENREDYFLEETDSLFYGKGDFEPIEETRVINGFKCHGYNTKITRTFSRGTMVALIKTPIIYDEYTLWVTDELKLNDELNPLMLNALRTQTNEYCEFKGVLVQLEYKIIYNDRTWNNIIELDVTKLDQKPEVFTWPWEDPKCVAWLEGKIQNNTSLVLFAGYEIEGASKLTGKIEPGSYMYRIGDGSGKVQNARLTALLLEITGQEKPRTKHRYFSTYFWLTDWGF